MFVNSQLGLGHAVLARTAIGSDPFAVLLADDFLTHEGEGVTADLYAHLRHPVRPNSALWKSMVQIFPNMELSFQKQNEDRSQA